jgi:polysaccharide pyruvyl transferase WcaK-like protein
LLKDDFDPSRHRQGVDMAFNLGAVDPGDKLGSEIRAWLEDKPNHLLIGLNVSGMIALDPEGARRQFDLRADYLDAIAGFLRVVMEKHDFRLVFIPHVMSPLTSLHSDTAAGLKIVEALPPRFRSRIIVAPRTFDEREVKWLISKMDWFCGTRMHATIAALSSGVPTATLPYSDKALGVFESCGVEDQVIDPRKLDTPAVIERLVESFESRERTKELLSTTIGVVKARATEQLECTTDMLRALA